MTLLLAGATRRRRSGFEPDNGFMYPLPDNGTLVTVPTYDGSGRSIHPAVLDMGVRWNGYRWWFADTPYPPPEVPDYQQYENPSIFASNNRAIWEVPAGVSNPLVTPPPNGNHSDPALAWDTAGGRMVIYWRESIANRSPQFYMRTKWSHNGVTWNEADPLPLNGPYEYLSPMVRQVAPGDWRLWFFGYLATRPPVMFQSSSPLGPWTYVTACDVGGVTNWHGDVIAHEGILFGIFSDKSTAFPMASTDGITWTVGASLSIGSYRPTMAISTETGEMDIWSSSMARSVRYYRRPLALWTNLLP